MGVTNIILIAILVYGFLALWLAEGSTFNISGFWKRFFSVSYKICFSVLAIVSVLYAGADCSPFNTSSC